MALALSSELLDFLSLVVVRDGPPEVTSLTLDHIADALRAVPVHLPGFGTCRQASHLEDQESVPIVVNHELRVRRLAVVFVAQSPTDAENARRQLVLAESPAADVHLVDPLVTEIAVARGPYPVPVVV